jgi:GntR family transcriptional repressor for pyruvate dehydrogenase complex
MDLRRARTAPFDRPSTPRGAAARLRDLIADGRMRPGDRLPGQRELSEQLGVSRASLREALSVLETLGLVSVQAGRGVFVAEPPQQVPPWPFADRCAPRDVYEARTGVEGFAAELAAERLDDDGLRALDQAVARLRSAFERDDIAGMADADSTFHDIVVEASANPMLVAMVRSVREMLVESQRLPMSGRTKLEETVREHEALLASFRARDATGAGERMRAHIRAAASRLGVAF